MPVDYTSIYILHNLIILLLLYLNINVKQIDLFSIQLIIMYSVPLI